MLLSWGHPGGVRTAHTGSATRGDDAMPAQGIQSRLKIVGAGERLDRGHGRAGGPRRWLALAVPLLLAAAATPGYTAPSRQGAPAAGAEPSQAAHIVALARDAMARYDLKAIIVRVTI